MASVIQTVIDEIQAHESNAWAREIGYRPLWQGSAAARVAVISQAPGIRAQESSTPWNDVSGRKLRTWLGVSDAQFYDPELFALVGMDFYYPGKGRSGDLPPRRDFAPRWHPRIFAALPNVEMRILVGSYAQRFYLGSRAKPTLTETVRSYQEYLPEYFPLAHPSPLNRGWFGRNTWFHDEVLPELVTRVAALIAGPRARG